MPLMWMVMPIKNHNYECIIYLYNKNMSRDPSNIRARPAAAAGEGGEGVSDHLRATEPTPLVTGPPKPPPNGTHAPTFYEDMETIVTLDEDRHRIINAAILSNPDVLEIFKSLHDEELGGIYIGILFYYLCMKYFDLHSRIDVESVLNFYNDIPNHFRNQVDGQDNILILYYRFFVEREDLERLEEFERAVAFYYTISQVVDIDGLSSAPLASYPAKNNKFSISSGRTMSLDVADTGLAFDPQALLGEYIEAVYPRLVKPFKGYINVTTVVPAIKGGTVAISSARNLTASLPLNQGMVDTQPFYLNYLPGPGHSVQRYGNGAEVYRIPRRYFFKTIAATQLKITCKFEIVQLVDGF